MGFLKNMFGTQQKASPMHADLKSRFGLNYRGNGWAYEGHVDDSHASILNDPELCFMVLKQLRASLKFGRICVVAGRPVTIVADAQRPFCMVTSLGASATAEVVAAIVRAGGRLIAEDNGVFLLNMP